MSNTMTRNGKSAQDRATASNVVFTPRFDIAERDDEFILTGDFPGVTAEGLELRVENRELTVVGRVEPRPVRTNPWMAEYGVGDLYRSFRLNESIDVTKISAEIKDGVLTLHLPKKAETQPMRIAVKAG